MLNDKNGKDSFKDRLVQFSLSVMALTDGLPDTRKFWIIEDQLIRAATSIGANVVEAKASSSRRDYIKFFQIALKSANEVDYWLVLCQRMLPSETKINQLRSEAVEICRIIASSLITLKGKRSL